MSLEVHKDICRAPTVTPLNDYSTSHITANDWCVGCSVETSGSNTDFEPCYRGTDNSLARSTSRCILFDG